MFDIGWSEILIIAAIAVIVIGPKDLPRTLRTIGQWVGKAKSMARDFQKSIDDVIRESELDEVKKQIDSAANLDFKEQIEKTIDPDEEIRKATDLQEELASWDEDMAKFDSDEGDFAPPSGKAESTAGKGSDAKPNSAVNDQKAARSDDGASADVSERKPGA